MEYKMQTWDQSNRFHAFKRGFKDGDNGTNKRELFCKYQEYLDGYYLGYESYKNACAQFLQDNNIPPTSILR